VKKSNDLAVKIRYRTTKGTKRHVFLDWVNYVDLSPKEAAFFACVATHTLITYYENLFADKPTRLTEFRTALRENGLSIGESEGKRAYIS
jgi:hypothetical protein